MEDKIQKRATYQEFLQNPARSLNKAYQKLVPNPATQAALYASLPLLAGILLWKPVVNTTKSLVRPLAYATGYGQDFDQGMDQLKQDGTYKWVIPAVAAGGLAAADIYGHWNKNKPNGGMFDPWPLSKKQSLQKKADLDDWNNSYIPDVDFGQIINPSDASQLFTNSSMYNASPYAANLGTSILMAAPRSSRNATTMGNVYDSAVNKLHKKFSLQGIADTAVRAVAANTAASLFTDALGTMINISPKAQQRLVDAGTWAATITSILE